MKTQEQENNQSFTPTDYFNYVKDKKQTITNQDLRHIYDNCLVLLSKSIRNNQQNAAKKLVFQLECIEKELEVVKLGIDPFVYHGDILEFIQTVQDKAVKITRLEQYEREIPDDVSDRLALVKEHFNQFYVLFTDYTGEFERQVEKERRDKDPILFGTFQDQANNTYVDRFYFIGDWEDEYCDITLEKMVSVMKDVQKKDIEFKIRTPLTLDELRKQVDALVVDEQGSVRMHHHHLNARIKKQNVWNRLTALFQRAR